MKTAIVFFSLFLSTSAFAEKAEFYQINLDWNDKASLEDNVTQQCDDTYLAGVDLTIPGKAGVDFDIEMVVSINQGKISSGCTFVKYENATNTKFRFDASGGGCEVNVHKIRRDFTQKPQSATYGFSDAC